MSLMYRKYLTKDENIMEEDSSDCPSEPMNAQTTTAVLNGNTLITLGSTNGEGDKSDLMNDKYETTVQNFITTEGVLSSIVDANSIQSISSNGIGKVVLSVQDAENHGEVTLNCITSVADLSNPGLCLGDAEQAVSDGTQLLIKTDDGLNNTAHETVLIKPIESNGNRSVLLKPMALSSQNEATLQLVTNGHETISVIPISSEEQKVECLSGRPNIYTPITQKNINPVEKRRGGWPKGKKRKPGRNQNAPKAPATGYVLYAVERRSAIKEMYPDLTFPQVTKILGQEWSMMSTEERQKYIDQAEVDKKRYIEELKEYQKSDKRKRKDDLHCDVSLNNPVTADSEDDGLYCRVCDQYFTSQHNRKEHMFGKLHLQNITKIMEEHTKAETETMMSTELPGQGLLNPNLTADTTEQTSISTDIEKFTQAFWQKNVDREIELRELSRSVQSAKKDHVDYLSKLAELKELETKLDQDVGNLKAYGAALSAQIDGLRMVPTLFGVINF